MYRAIDGCGGQEQLIAAGVATPGLLDQGVSGNVEYGYRIRQTRADGVCTSDYSACQSAQTGGTCTAPPAFDGVQSANSTGASLCSIELSWGTATPRCAGPASFTLDRSIGTSFDENTATQVAANVSASPFVDSDIQFGNTYTYRVRSVDTSNGTADANNIVLSAQPVGPIGDGTFSTGAEIGEQQLSTIGRHVGWEVVDDTARSGERSYYSTYENDNCLNLQSPVLEVTTGQSSELEFYTRYAIESGWDAGLVQISNNGGPWQTITPIGGYPAVMNNQNSTDACGFANGQPAFTGTDLDWESYRFDLSAFSGQIQLRWQFSTDGGATDQGWWLDDVTISHVQVGGACSSEELFENGFE